MNRGVKYEIEHTFSGIICRQIWVWCRCVRWLKNNMSFKDQNVCVNYTPFAKMMSHNKNLKYRTFLKKGVAAIEISFFLTNYYTMSFSFHFGSFVTCERKHYCHDVGRCLQDAAAPCSETDVKPVEVDRRIECHVWISYHVGFAWFNARAGFKKYGSKFLVVGQICTIQ